MANPGGGNQLGKALEPYGQAKQLKELMDEAPMSGAPVATNALQAPRRARKAPQRQRQVKPQSAPIPPVTEIQQPSAPDPQQMYQQIASIPGASPLVQEIFGGPSQPSAPAPAGNQPSS